MRPLNIRRSMPPDENLFRSLSEGWSDLYGGPVTVTADSPGQRWLRHLPTDAYFAAQPNNRIRRRLADQFRYTPFMSRRIPQYLIGTAAASRAMLPLFSVAGFSVAPEIPGASNILILAGGRRIRIFDYATGKCRAMLRPGVDTGMIEREIELRGAKQRGPFVTIVDFNLDKGWFEEPIFDGYNLARLPLRYNSKRLQIQACAGLRQWQKPLKRKENTADYLENLGKKIQKALIRFAALPGCGGLSLLDRVTQLARIAEEITPLFSAPSHGDLQPGNIMVSSDGHRTILVDWEFSARRAEHYDSFVLALGSRWSGQLASNAARYLRRGRSIPLLESLNFNAGNRRAALALFLIEDLLFYLEESSLTGTGQPSPGLLEFIDQLQKLMSRDEFAGVIS